MPLKINGSVNIIQGPGFAKHFCSSSAAPRATSPLQFLTQLLSQSFANASQFPMQLLFQKIYVFFS